MSSEEAQDYTVFGLRIRSAVELPELFPAVTAGEPDVIVELGTVTAPPADPGLEVVESGLLLTVPEVARFLISDGSRLVVDPVPGCDPRNVRLFLLGSAFGALLHQRGLLPLHANAVEIDGRAFAFMGASGVGKSTLAAWFHDRGHPLLADDVCVVQFDDQGRLMARPGLPRLRLWLDALEKSGREVAGLARSYAGGTEPLDKYDVPLGADSMLDREIPVGAIYLLDQGEKFAIERLSGIHAADAIFANTYRGGYVGKAGTHKEHWQTSLRVASMIPVFRATRSMDMERFEAQADAMQRHALGCRDDAPAEA